MQNKPMLLALIGVWALLLVASFIVFILTRLQRNKDYRELVSRTRSWWVMIAIFTLAILTNRIVSLCFFGLISFLALKEYCNSPGGIGIA